MRAFAAVAVLAVTLLSGCGGDDNGDDDLTASASAAAGAGDVDRYCQLTSDLDKAGDEAFSALEKDDSATEDDYAEAERQFLAEHSDDFAEIQQAAPAEIRDDIAVLIQAQSERAAGGDQTATSADVKAAEKNVSAFEDQHC